MMLTKLRTAVILAVSVFFLASCGDDDSENGPSYSFKDQNLQGTINGIDFSFSEGRAEDGGDEFSFDLFDNSEDITDVCDFFGADEVTIFFSIPKAVGIYELKFDFDDIEGSQTVTLFDPAETLNIIASSGAVEIISVSDTQVTGRMDANAGNGDAVNGNFTLSICQ